MPEKAPRRARKSKTKAASLAAATLRAEAEKVDQYIAEQLKALYDAVVVEPVPDKLLRLLNRLDDDAEQ